MPCGLTIALPTFYWLMDNLFGDLLGKKAMSYLDDVVVSPIEPEKSTWYWCMRRSPAAASGQLG